MSNQKNISPITRPPVVTILGHVDHGKTTLLDTIRKTNIASHEFGGITQHIGAYQIEVPTTPSKGQKRKSYKITFIDTPGHEAFTKMRSRGADVADIAILVVAANDGVMPQTIESIKHITAAKIPFIVAVNKIDLPDINLEKIKKQLVKQGLKLEEYGGETPVIGVSAKTATGIDKLLDMILLLVELHQMKDLTHLPLKAVTIESVLSKNRGPVATVVVRSGKIHVGEDLVCDSQIFRVRALISWTGISLNEIGCGDAAEILGWQQLPIVGSIIYDKKNSEIIETTDSKIIVAKTPGTLEAINSNTTIEEERIKIIIKSDTYGTLEAIMASLPNNVLVIEKGVGNINESDVLLAKTAKALIIGFHLKPNENVKKLADSEKVYIKTYNIIYELIDEIDDVVEALKKGNLVEIFGEARVIAIFPIDDQKVAGVKVISGRVARGDQVKIMRKDVEIGRCKIKSLKHNKDDVNKAEQGSEAGVLLSQNIDLLTGDSIISIG